ncbi:MAG TPA: glycosyltransferase family 4 protein [Planctomycetota bacterium]|nr:glycosyltransferase family 4 protein [Planctomycetota bacterium]
MDKVNVAMMIFPAEIGGAEAVVGEILRHLDRSLFNCFLVTTDEHRAYFDEIGATTVFSLGPLRRLDRRAKLMKWLHRLCPSRFSRRAFLPSKLRAAADFLTQNQVHILHAHLTKDQRFAARLRVRNLKKVMTVHGVLDLDVELYDQMHPGLLGRVLARAGHVTSACRYFLDRLDAFGIRVRERATIIENGINQELVAAKREPPAEDDILTMTYLGGVRHEKGGDLLVNALRIVVHERGVRNVRLEILRDVSPGSELHSLIQRCSLQDYITLVGYVPGGDHLRHISRNDLFVLPSRTEGIANTLMEAVGLGKPILATSVGGTPEVVTHGQNGYLCKPTAEGLAEGILFFANHPEKLKDYAAANQRLAGRFAWPQVVRRYEDLYRSLSSVSSEFGGHHRMALT